MLKQFISSRIVNITLVLALSAQSIAFAIPADAGTADYPSQNSETLSHESGSGTGAGFFDFIISIFKKHKNDNQNTVKEYDPNEARSNNSLFSYVPGEIIIKFKNNYALESTEKAIKKMPLEFDAESLNTEPIIPVLKEKKQGKFMNSTSDYASVQKAGQAGLDRLYNIDIPDLQKKSELFIEKFKHALSKTEIQPPHEGVKQNIVRVPTQEFGLVEIDVSQQDYIIDPYTLQLLDELKKRSDVEYAVVNARVSLDTGVFAEERTIAPEETAKAGQELSEIQIPGEEPVEAEEIVKEADDADEADAIDEADAADEVDSDEQSDAIGEETGVADEADDSAANEDPAPKSQGLLQNIVNTIENAVGLLANPLQDKPKNNKKDEPTAPLEPLFAEQWSLHNTGQSFHFNKYYSTSGSIDADINFLETYKDADYKKGVGVIVAVLDSGISYTNEGIDDNLWINQAEIPVGIFAQIDANSDGEVASREILTYIENESMDLNADGKYNFADVLNPNSVFINGIDENGDGYTDDIIGYDFVSYESGEDGLDDSGYDRDPYDWHGHGTHVSGTIAAEEDGQGIIGIASQAKIMAVRGFDKYGGGDTVGLIEGIYYAANHGANLTNNSWGGIFTYQPLTDAFDYAYSMGVISVASSGNDDHDVANNTPANIDSVISVGNYNSYNSRNSSSNYGSTLDASAPGTYIISLLSAGSYFDQHYQDYVYNGHLIISGTSMASPHITGILAGVKSSATVDLTPKRARQLLRLAEKDDEYFTVEFGYGRVDEKKLFDLRDAVLPTVNIASPQNEATVSGASAVQADISGDYSLSSVTASGSSADKYIPAQTICVGAIFSGCTLDATALKENESHAIEIRLKDENGNVLARDAVVVMVDNLQLNLSDQKSVYGKNDVISLQYSVEPNGREVAYRVVAEPAGGEGDGISIIAGSNSGPIEGSAEVRTSLFPGSGEYKIVLEADYQDSAGALNTVTEEKNIYVDRGLKDNFPVYYDASRMIGDIAPVQILNLDKTDDTREIYSPKSECVPYGGGWYSCAYESELWQVNANGQLRDIMPDIGLENSLTGYGHYILGNASPDNGAMAIKLYNIAREEDGMGGGYTYADKGTIASLSSDNNLDWQYELEDAFDPWEDETMMLAADMDSDKQSEYVFMRQKTWLDGQFAKIYILDAEGNLLNSFNSSDKQDDRITTSMIVGNFDANADTKEILTTSIIPDCDDYYGCSYTPALEYLMRAFDANGTLLWEKSIPGSDGTYTYSLEDGPYSVDVDNNGIDEIVALESKYGNGVYSLPVNVYSNEGELLGSYETNDNYNYGWNENIAFGDIDGDEKTDALVTNGIYYTALTLDNGKEIFAKEISEPKFGKSHIIIFQAAIADFNSDDKAEIMLATSSRYGAAFGDPIPKSFRLFDNKGDEITNEQFPKIYPSLRNDAGNDIDAYDGLSIILPQIADFDNDGVIDIVFQTLTVEGFENTYYATEAGGNPNSIQADGSYGLNPGRTGHYEPLVITVPIPDNGLNAAPRDESALISWNQDQSAPEDIAGYNVYQSLSYDAFEDEPINKKLIEENEYEVKKLANWTTYYFAITAVDKDGRESEFSDATIVTPYPGPYMQFGEEKEIAELEQFRNMAISDNKLAWVEYSSISNTSGIYIYDAKTGEKSAITSNLEESVYFLDISGTTVIWSQNIGAEGKVYAYNLDKKEKTTISNNVINKYALEPQIFGEYVVWTSSDGDKSEIYLHDMKTGLSKRISSVTGNPYSPKISGDNIVYKVTDPMTAITDLYLYNIDSSEQSKIVSSVEGYLTIDLYDSYVVWTSSFIGEERVRLYDINTKEIKKIGFTNSSQYHAYINNNKIVWTDERGHDAGLHSNIYMYDLSTENEYNISFNSYIEKNPAVDGGTIVWLRYENNIPHLYMRSAYTVPDAPLNVTIDDEIKNTEKDTPDFRIDWENPFDPSGIYGIWYKLGDRPESDEDGIFTAEKPFIAIATEKNQNLYLWLENNDGHKNYENNQKVTLKYNPKEQKPEPKPEPKKQIPVFLMPPAPAPTAGGEAPNGSSAPSNVQIFSKTPDGTEVASEKSSIIDQGKIVGESITSNLTLSKNPSASQTIKLNTAKTAVVKEMSVALPKETLQEFASVFGTEAEFKVTVTNQEAEQNQKTEYARQGLYLEGFDVFSIGMSSGKNIINRFANPVELTFDISSVNFDKASLKVYYFNEKNGTWARAGNGGIVEGDKIKVAVDHLTDFGIVREYAESGVGGAEIPAAGEWRQIISDAQMIALSGANSDNLNSLISYTGNMKDMDAQIFWTGAFSAPLSSEHKLNTGQMYAVNNFIVYGTSGTQNIGQKERAGVISSYQKAYNKLPITVDDWRDCIAIAAGRWPNQKNPDTEARAIDSFQKIYQRAPDMKNAHDNAAVTLMAYGVRVEERNLDSEKSSIRLFKNVFRYLPSSPTDWNIVRAITYSGASR